jgi:NADPH:quinone reductase-like Zn-dependent oxidoreductase
MRKRLTVGGSTLRARDNATKAKIASELRESVWPLFESGKVQVVMDSQFALCDAADAHRRMESSQHIGKIVLTM